jgi:hypothetical protein
MGTTLGQDLTSTGRRGPFSRENRHEHAVARTLEFAEEAASRGDLTDALAWLQTIEWIGRRLPDEYLSKRQEWRLALASDQADRGRL